MSHLLAIDAGTTGVTCARFDLDLTLVDKAYREFPQSFPRPGWVEHEASAILGAVDATLAEVVARRPGTPILALGITNQRETVFALDRSDGRALGPGIVWQDRRTAERCAALSREGRASWIRERTGLVLDPYFSATKIEWMLAERPEVAARARSGGVLFCTVDALIVRHLTRGATTATDPTNASRTMLYDIREGAWSAELGKLFGVDPAWLPAVLPSTGEYGEAELPDGSRVPIRGVAGDQQAALFGQACYDEGSFKNTYGTGCFVLLNTGGRRVESKRGLLSTLAVGRDGSIVHALEGSVFSGGSIMQWLRDGLGILPRASDSEALARSVADTGGVFLVPAFTGLGAPWWDADARAALLGMTRGTTRAHIVRAGLEAIAYQCADLIEIMRDETKLAIDSLRVDGGAAANDFLMQCQADLAGVEIVRPPALESTARGAAALAGLGAGAWKDPSEARGWEAGTKRFQPSLDASARKDRLEAWHRAVRRVIANDRELSDRRAAR
jgi:glycerol kinase